MSINITRGSYNVFWSNLHRRGQRYFCIDSSTGYLHKTKIYQGRIRYSFKLEPYCRVLTFLEDAAEETPGEVEGVPIRV